MLSQELEQLRKLHDEGELSDEEYAEAKARLLNQSSALTNSEHPTTNNLLGFTPSTYAMVIHLSQYAGYVLPFAGMVIPVALWLYGRDQNEFIESHGRAVMNFLISYLVYSVAVGILCFLLIGFILLPILLLVILILPIVAAIEASHGKTYEYPFVIRFFT